MSRISRWPKRSSVPFITAAALSMLLAPGAEGGHLLCDGVVLDAGSGMAYAMNPDGGIEAIELATGAVHWSSSEAAKPLHLTEGLLIAHRDPAAPGSVDMVALATRSGSRQHGMTATLAEGVWAGVDDRPGGAFRCHAGGGVADLAVSWSAYQAVDDRFAVTAPAFDETSGPVIPPAAPAGALSGSAELDLVAGRMTPMAPGQIAAGSLSVASEETGVFLAGVPGRQWLSADGAHVLSSARTGAPGEWQKYRWSVYTTAGELVGTISHHLASVPFVVTGTTLVFRDQPYALVVDGALVSEPLKLRGVDLRSGVEIWSRALRDTAYRGPFEP